MLFRSSMFSRTADCDEDGWFNLLLLNSHNGSSSIRLEAGYFRILCENQLGSGDVGTRIIHRGDAVAKFEQAVPLVLGWLVAWLEGWLLSFGWRCQPTFRTVALQSVWP